MDPAKPIFAARYMVDFQCIGSQCEDNCCGGWRIHVDEKHYRKLKLLMGETPAGQARFAASFERNRGPDRNRSSYARLKLREDESCPMLAEDGWCTLHRDYGEPVLPDTCSAYPRSIGLLGQRRELFGSISCPEVARRALLAEDALDLVPVDAAVLGRGVVKHTVLGGTHDPYVRHFDEVRAAMDRLLQQSRHPIEVRLFAAACFGARTAAFFHQKTKSFDGAALERELAATRDEELLSHLGEQLASAVPPAIGLEVVVGLVAARLIRKHPSAFYFLVERIMLDYALGGGTTPQPILDADNAPNQRLFDGWAARRRAFPKSLLSRLGRYLENYCRQAFLDDWYFSYPDLFVFVQQLLVRVATLRFLLISHPAIPGLAALPEAEAQAELDRAAVEVFYTLAREIEHSQQFMDALARALGVLKLYNLPATVAFLKL